MSLGLAAALKLDEAAEVAKIDPEKGISLPGWDASYKPEELKALLEAYKSVDEQKLWANLEYFLKKVIPVAEKAYVNENGGTRILFGKSTAELKKIVRGIMYENGKSFIDRWLNNFAG